MKFFPLAIPFLFISSCYYISQGSVLFSHQLSARNSVELLRDEKTPQELRAFLLKAGQVREFAVKELGLKDTKNYTTYVKTDRDYLASVVQAAATDRFEPFLWDYPFFGKMPYKGFFDETDARRLEAELEKMGYDTLIRKVDAFSTLGWFKDPLFSFMIKYRDMQLAELIIHEMTHATIFAAGQSNFNEELASFVGRRGAMLWLKRIAGENSLEAALEADLDADATTYALMLRELAGELESVYSSNIERRLKLEKKLASIAAFRQRYAAEYSFRFRTPWYKDALPEKLNNAWIELFRLYEGESELYSKFLETTCSGSIPVLVGKLGTEAAKGNPDIKTFMRSN